MGSEPRTDCFDHAPFPPREAAPRHGDHLLARWRGVTGPAIDSGEHLSLSFALAPGQLPARDDVVRLVLSVEDAGALANALLDRLHLYLDRRGVNVQSPSSSGRLNFSGLPTDGQ